jgi:DNA-binding MarR family transcriptional regulator
VPKHADSSTRGYPPSGDPKSGESPSGESPRPLTKAEYEELAGFRAALRKYLRFSEELVRAHGLTPQQYQLLLAVKGYPGRDWATVGELAEQLQLRHHSVVELIDRAQRADLVCRAADPGDARVVRVQLTPKGAGSLGRLSALHKEQLLRLDPDSLSIPFTDPD